MDESLALQEARWDQWKNRLANSAAWLFAQFLLQLLIGVVLAVWYRPTPEVAYASVQGLSNLGVALRSAHYWGSALLIVHGVLHLLAMLAYGGASRANKWRFWATLVMAGGAIGFQLTGNLLPWDRHGVQTAVIELAIAGRAPILGHLVAGALRGGETFGAGTLSVWKNIHFFALPVLLIAAGVAASVSHVKLKDANHNSRWLIVPVLVTLAVSLIGAPLADAATSIDYESFDAKSSWYVLPMHGLLILGDRFLGNQGAMLSVATPGIAALVLLVLPLLSPKIQRHAPALSVALLLGIIGLGWLGAPPAPLIGKRNPVSEEILSTDTSKPALPPTIDQALVAKGEKLFDPEGCSDCHGKGGKGGDGGPPLTKTRERHPDADFYIRYIRNPRSVKKSSTMPAYDSLKEDQLAALAEYLRAPR